MWTVEYLKAPSFAIFFSVFVFHLYFRYGINFQSYTDETRLCVPAEWGYSNTLTSWYDTRYSAHDTIYITIFSRQYDSMVTSCECPIGLGWNPTPCPYFIHTLIVTFCSQFYYMLPIKSELSIIWHYLMLPPLSDKTASEDLRNYKWAHAFMPVWSL